MWQTSPLLVVESGSLNDSTVRVDLRALSQEKWVRVQVPQVGTDTLVRVSNGLLVAQLGLSRRNVRSGPVWIFLADSSGNRQALTVLTTQVTPFGQGRSADILPWVTNFCSLFIAGAAVWLTMKRDRFAKRSDAEQRNGQVTATVRALELYCMQLEKGWDTACRVHDVAPVRVPLAGVPEVVKSLGPLANEVASDVTSALLQLSKAGELISFELGTEAHDPAKTRAEFSKVLRSQLSRIRKAVADRQY